MRTQVAWHPVLCCDGSLELLCHRFEGIGQLGLCTWSWLHDVVWEDTRTGDTRKYGSQAKNWYVTW